MADLTRSAVLADHVELTGGAVHLDDCRAAGLTDEQVEWFVASGRWQSPFPRVYVTFSGPIPRRTLEHAALAYAGENAALGYESAGAYWGLCPTPARIHVVVPYSREYRLHVELDGRLGHDRAEEVWRDMRRDNASEVDRFRHLRYGWADMLGRECAVAIEQAVILRQQGWTGTFRRCPDCPGDLPPGL